MRKVILAAVSVVLSISLVSAGMLDGTSLESQKNASGFKFGDMKFKDNAVYPEMSGEFKLVEKARVTHLKTRNNTLGGKVPALVTKKKENSKKKPSVWQVLKAGLRGFVDGAKAGAKAGAIGGAIGGATAGAIGGAAAGVIVGTAVGIMGGAGIGAIPGGIIGAGIGAGIGIILIIGPGAAIGILLITGPGAVIGAVKGVRKALK